MHERSDPRPLVAGHALGRSIHGVAALDDVDFAAGPGEIIALLGGNGAGKTSLLELLAGVRRPSRGRVDWGVPGGPAGIGWIPQSPALYRQLTCRENVVFFARMAGVGHPARRAEELLRRVGLLDVADRRAAALSTGMRQRLNIAVGLVAAPRLVLMDEPAATLSIDHQRRMWEWMIPAVGNEGALVFSTQSLREARIRASRVVVLSDGRIVFDGTADRIVAEFGTPDDSNPEDDAFARLLEARA